MHREAFDMTPRIAGGVTALLAALAARSNAQLPRVRDSAGVRIVENRVADPDAITWRVVDSTPVVTIGGPGAKGNAALGTVMGALRLPDGQIVVADFDHKRVSFFNSKGIYRFGVDVVAISGRLEQPWNLFPFGPGKVAEWDGVADQVMVLNGKSSVTHTVRVHNPPDQRELRGWSRAFLSLVGAFGTGDMIGTVKNPVAPHNRQIRMDSFAIYHVTANGRAATLGLLFREERFTFDGHYSVTGQLPLGRNGSIAVDDDAWFYTDGSAFEVQRRAPSGKPLARFRMSRSRRPVTPVVIQRLKRARLARSYPVERPDDSLALEWMPFPSQAPAYTALQVDDEHHVWARIWTIDGEPATWDVFAASGQFPRHRHRPARPRRAADCEWLSARALHLPVHRV